MPPANGNPRAVRGERQHKTKKEIKRLHDALLDRMQTPEQKAGIKAAFDKLTQNQERGE